MKNENWKNEKVSKSEKWKLNISRSALLYMKTRDCLKYFVNDCKYIVSVFHSIFACLQFASLRKFQGSSESRFGNSEKDRYFLKIQNARINLFGHTSQES